MSESDAERLKSESDVERARSEAAQQPDASWYARKAGVKSSCGYMELPYCTPYLNQKAV